MAEVFLLDTHAVVWSALAPDELSKRARAIIEDDANMIMFSPVSAMEIATKVRIGKFELARPLARGFGGQMSARRFFELSLTSEHAELAGSFSSPNNDPWDRLLAAQAQIERATLITCDGKMDGFGITTLW
jgi:PIN domain nuclease of toxin-antitoxin system